MEPKVDEPAFQVSSGPVTVPPSSYPTSRMGPAFLPP
jgi:hypothetical protein